MTYKHDDSHFNAPTRETSAVSLLTSESLVARGSSIIALWESHVSLLMVWPFVDMINLMNEFEGEFSFELKA